MLFKLTYQSEVDAGFSIRFTTESTVDDVQGSIKDNILLDFRGYGHAYGIISVTNKRQWKFKASGEAPFKLAVLGDRDAYILSCDNIVTIVDLRQRQLKYCSHKEHNIGDLMSINEIEILIIDEQGEQLQILEYDESNYSRVKQSFGWYEADEEGFHHTVYFDQIQKVDEHNVYCRIKDESGNAFVTVHSKHALQWMNKTGVLEDIKRR